MAVVTLDPGLTKTLTILSGQTTSADVLSFANRGRKGFYSMMVFGPVTLPETVKIQVAPMITRPSFFGTT